MNHEEILQMNHESLVEKYLGIHELSYWKDSASTLDTWDSDSENSKKKRSAVAQK